MKVQLAQPAKGFHGNLRWPLVRIGEVASLHYGKSLIASSRNTGEVRVYGSNGQCGWHDTPLDSGPTVILGRKGQGPLGVEWCPWPFWVIDTAYYVTVDAQRIDLRYFYFLTKFIGLNHLKDGTSNPSLSRDVFSQQGVPLPPLPMQRRIASVLSAYDELIENSLRRIRLLEAMARALYREWFVHFRFPDHENHPRVPSPLGKLPEGWQTKRVPDCVHINPRIAVPRDGEKPFVPMGCLSNDSMLISDVESRDAHSGAKFQNGDTLIARITPCLENGKTGFVQFLTDPDAVACGSTEFIVLRSRTLTPEFVYCLARSDEFRGVAIKSMSGATGRQRVQEQCFQDFQIAQPPRTLLDQFSAIVAPSFHLIYKLHLQIQNLHRTRDLLLPRLLSGQVILKQN